MYTVRFQVPSLRPDVARFATLSDAQAACNTLINRMYYGRPIRVVVMHKGASVFNYERK